MTHIQTQIIHYTYTTDLAPITTLQQHINDGLNNLQGQDAYHPQMKTFLKLVTKRINSHTMGICNPGNSTEVRSKRQIFTTILGVTLYSVFSGILSTLFKPQDNNPLYSPKGTMDRALKHSAEAIKFLEVKQNVTFHMLGVTYTFLRLEMATDLMLDSLQDRLNPNKISGIGYKIIQAVTKNINGQDTLDLSNSKFLVHLAQPLHSKIICEDTKIYTTLEASIKKWENITIIEKDKYILHSNTYNLDFCYQFDRRKMVKNTIMWPIIQIACLNKSQCHTLPIDKCKKIGEILITENILTIKVDMDIVIRCINVTKNIKTRGNSNLRILEICKYELTSKLAHYIINPMTTKEAVFQNPLTLPNSATYLPQKIYRPNLKPLKPEYITYSEDNQKNIIIITLASLLMVLITTFLAIFIHKKHPCTKKVANKN